MRNGASLHTMPSFRANALATTAAAGTDDATITDSELRRRAPIQTKVG